MVFLSVVVNFEVIQSTAIPVRYQFFVVFTHPIRTTQVLIAYACVLCMETECG